MGVYPAFLDSLKKAGEYVKEIGAAWDLIGMSQVSGFKKTTNRHMCLRRAFQRRDRVSGRTGDSQPAVMHCCPACTCGSSSVLEH